MTSLPSRGSAPMPVALAAEADQSSSPRQAADIIIMETADNYVNGGFEAPASGEYLPVTCPSTGATIGRVAASDDRDVEEAVRAARRALPGWSALTVKARAAVLLRFHALVRDRAEELADLIVLENGKNRTEALADVAKGNETVEYACGLPSLAQGRNLQVSTAVCCHDERRPLGVVASVVPFNFPFMVPMWTFPIAVVMGNCFILKPSEKVPLTMRFVASLVEEAGFPPGVFGMVQGTQGAAQALIRHPEVRAVTFVGSSPVARAVSDACRSLHKRCTSLGGAKNHLVALPDCDAGSAAADVCVSFAGCAGQRCMAASVLLTVGPNPALVGRLVEAAAALKPGTGPGQMGPVIDKASHAKILSYIEAAEADGATILLDGRSWCDTMPSGGSWIGPTILRHRSPSDKTMRDEVFGPVLSVYECASWEEAIEIENASDFGNAASVYTTNGANAEWFTSRFRASMLGVNIGIPVPREPFSFGGLYGTRSKFGDMDITGDAGMEFFSNRVKVTSKWPLKRKASDIELSGTDRLDVNGNHTARPTTTIAASDQANFAGSM